jgi:hypothetical protein
VSERRRARSSSYAGAWKGVWERSGIGQSRIAVRNRRIHVHGVGLQVPLPESENFPTVTGTNSHW